MDDLLTAALNESGLGDFLSEDVVEISGDEKPKPGKDAEVKEDRENSASAAAPVCPANGPSTSKQEDVSLQCHDYGRLQPEAEPVKPQAAAAAARPPRIVVFYNAKGARGSPGVLRARTAVIRGHSALATSRQPATVRRLIPAGSVPSQGQGRYLRIAGGGDGAVRVLSSANPASPSPTLIRRGAPLPRRIGYPSAKPPVRLLNPPPPSLPPQQPELVTRTLFSAVGTKRPATDKPQASKRAKPDPKPGTKPDSATVDVEEEDGLGQAETYAEYMPAKLRAGLPHPDLVVETSSLASVSPPDVRYQQAIPDLVVDEGRLSALQLEAVIYASQQHSCRLPSGERAGYLIGDGAGVGKGRTLAGVIFENFLRGRKRALWFSVSADLKYDSERDLADIGATKIKVHALNKLPYGRISAKDSGGIKKGVIFGTYSSLIGESTSSNKKSKYRSRLKQLLHWCGKDFDGVIVFDECHRAKNLMPIAGQKPTKTGSSHFSKVNVNAEQSACE